MRPSCAKLSCQRIALAGLTPNRFAAWRREAPSLRAETTRSRRSTDKADGMAAPSESRSANQIHTELTTRPDSTRSGSALARWAEVLKRDPDRTLRSLGEIEFVPEEEREALRVDGSPLTIAFEDPLLRVAGRASDRYGDAVRIFELSERE